MAQDHVIQRLTLEINAKNSQSSRQQQDELSHWFRSEVFWGKVSEKLDTLVSEDMVLTMPKLEITINGENENAIKQNFIEKLVHQIQQIVPSQEGILLQTVPTYLQQTALFFLEKGYLSSMISQQKAIKMQEFLENQNKYFDVDFWKSFQEKVPNNPQILERLIQHLGIIKVRIILAKLLKINTPIDEWIENIWVTKKTNITTDNSDRIVFEAKIWLFVLENSERGFLKNKAEFVETIAKIQTFNTYFFEKTTDSKNREEENNKSEIIGNDTVFYIENAGLVLLVPFLPQLFQALGWVVNNAWKDEQTQHQAVRLLDFLTHSHAGINKWEHEQILNKIICGIPIETVLMKHKALKTEDLESAEKMLQAVIDFWEVLKKTSPDSLREMFLRRSGKLSYNTDSNKWRLQVEKKPYDVLLERIPWGFSVVKLPLMKSIIFVAW